MNFKIKCSVQSVLSALPYNDRLNYLLQRYLSHSLPFNDDQFIKKTEDSLLHYRNFEEFNSISEKSNKYYEFGAGWHLIIPVSMCLLNFEVFCVDLRYLVFPDLIKDTLQKFIKNRDRIPFKFKKQVAYPSSGVTIMNYLKDNLGLHYFAPYDARETQFNDCQFDFISSTFTLEHIPQKDILPIFEECYRILKKGGVFSMVIDYQDHWSYFDSSITRYNFLKYSDKKWKKFNPSLHYQNRMRHNEYLDIISGTKFKIVKNTPHLPSESDINNLKTMTLDEKYKNIDLFDLGIRSAEIVLVK